ncbi:Protein GLUTAMINE DUMPER like [Quillaja saponaria]|uniref:Protein GLUTAMINE DUMPER like n=1 Tax=Quillaja saponaria TaxID=32244 RepID=A0AAD7VCP9_QUISA|nr:Protein GLUTAMINE DUMPER like [Quillaja saponaria]
MRPSNNVSPVTGVGLWKSPIPYLFGSIALVLTLILVALIILFCSYRKRASSSSSGSELGDPEKPAMSISTVIDTEPKIVVIMAGDDKPTYLAKPSTSSTCCCEKTKILVN